MSVIANVGAAVIALLLGVAPAAAALQTWIEYENRQDKFTINFPHRPAVQTSSYRSESGAQLPARVYSAEHGPYRYKVTVANFASRVQDESNAIAYEAAQLRRRGQVQYDAFVQLDGIPGHQVTVLNRDGTRTQVTLYFYDHLLYIAEGTAPTTVPPPSQFLQSIAIIDANGKAVNNDPTEQGEEQ